MSCTVHKCRIVVICLVKDCSSFLCYKCLLKHEHKNEDSFLDYEIFSDCIKKNPFWRSVEEVKPIIAQNEEQRKNIKMMLCFLSISKIKCTTFEIPNEKNLGITIYHYCRGLNHGCLKKTEKLWGTNIYTYDSEICLAARHSGVLGEDGGFCLVEECGGKDHYHGSIQNGDEKSMVLKPIFLLGEGKKE